MAQRKNWKYTRNGVEYTLSVGGLMKIYHGGWYTDSDGFSNWKGEPWEETVTILGFSKTGLYDTYKRGCDVQVLNTSNGKIDWHIISAPPHRQMLDFQHLDEVLAERGEDE
jgi:hypothetical protein